MKPGEIEFIISTYKDDIIRSNTMNFEALTSNFLKFYLLNITTTEENN